MRLQRLVVASKNPDKIREVEAVLEGLAQHVEIVRGLDWPEVEETEPTLEGNALLKARAVKSATGIASVADDTGLEVDALAGAPGVFTARYSGPDATYASNVAKLLADLEGVDERTARFRTAVALVDDDGDEVVVEGVLEGVISTERRGAGGFGYDPIFEVDGVTLAEMDPAQKNQISHRARALQALAPALRTRGRANSDGDLSRQ
ncbi:MAG: RdgB/HAM1 family non-canonical purine NTP pyrophosphatase [Acidimicrobiia bacterium]|nr:RdgB/HAM1 family non-canonical purine NTP pyrophosphatase [Acidimicrobiia bacterium]